jgi:hypothetical protein
VLATPAEMAEFSHLSEYSVRTICAERPELIVPRPGPSGRLRIKTAKFLREVLGLDDEHARSLIDVRTEWSA